MSRYFAIHGTMRTGSNLLERSLAALGDTVCHGEAFNPGFMGGPRKDDILGWTVAARDADPFGFLRAIRADAGARIAGFRIFDGHDSGIAAHTLADPDCARIVLRRDPLQVWVSLQIARKTGQWMLRDPRRRRTAMVRFDPAAFTAWRARAAAHYAWIAAEMERAGTAALWLDYERLGEPGTIAEAARHVGSAGRPPEAAPIVRQNPERLAEKVSNYAELCDWLGREPEPAVASPVPGPGDVLLGRHLPLACLPLAGPALGPSLSLMQRLEARAGGGRAVVPARLVAEPGAHFDTVAEAGALRERLVGRHIHAVACHPAERLHGLMLDALFGGEPGGAPVREAIAAHTGALTGAQTAALPSLRAVQRGEAAFPADLHRGALDAWLDLVAAAARGEGPLAAAPARLSQAEVLAAHAGWARPDTLGRLEDFPALAGAVAAAAGQRPLPPGQVSGLLRDGLAEAFPLARVLDAALARRVRALHGEDFAAFGYGEMPGG